MGSHSRLWGHTTQQDPKRAPTSPGGSHQWGRIWGCSPTPKTPINGVGYRVAPSPHQWGWIWGCTPTPLMGLDIGLSPPGPSPNPIRPPEPHGGVTEPRETPKTPRNPPINPIRPPAPLYGVAEPRETPKGPQHHRGAPINGDGYGVEPPPHQGVGYGDEPPPH